MADFGGDYGNYLKLLESDSALGFNPQADPIGENQVDCNLKILQNIIIALFKIVLNAEINMLLQAAFILN